jgi:hypothetical protein
MSDLDIAICTALLGPNTTKKIYGATYGKLKRSFPKLLKQNAFTKAIRALLIRLLKRYGVQFVTTHFKLTEDLEKLIADKLGRRPAKSKTLYQPTVEDILEYWEVTGCSQKELSRIFSRVQLDISRIFDNTQTAASRNTEQV